MINQINVPKFKCGPATCGREWARADTNNGSYSYLHYFCETDDDVPPEGLFTNFTGYRYRVGPDPAQNLDEPYYSGTAIVLHELNGHNWDRLLIAMSCRNNKVIFCNGRNLLKWDICHNGDVYNSNCDIYTQYWHLNLLFPEYPNNEYRCDNIDEIVSEKYPAKYKGYLSDDHDVIALYREISAIE